MHQVLSAAYYRPGFARSACAWLMIDGIGIEQWLSTHLEWSDVASLGLSLIWLIDEDEDALANRRIIPAEDGSSTIVPLLVCSDDMNFDCIVLVAEQVIDADTVHWRRFGRSISDKLEVGISTKWIAESKPVSFALEAFQNALEQFTQLSKTKPDNHCDAPLSPQEPSLRCIIFIAIRPTTTLKCCEHVARIHSGYTCFQRTRWSSHPSRIRRADYRPL